MEEFGYDALNRLTKTFAYDSIGNITSKSDVGTYSYPTPGSSSGRSGREAASAWNRWLICETLVSQLSHVSHICLASARRSRVSALIAEIGGYP